MLYKLDKNGNIIRIADSASIPDAPSNMDCAAYLAWIAEGNTPLPYEPPATDPKEQAKIELAASDKEMARIAEDLINVMLTKGVLAEADIPQSAHDKMARRAKLRSRLA